MPELRAQSSEPRDWLIVKDPETGGPLQYVDRLVLVREVSAERAIERVADGWGLGVYFALELGEPKLVRMEVTDA